MVPRASLVAQMVKNPPTMKETWIQFLGQEDPLEEVMAATCLGNPWTEEPGGTTVHGVAESNTTEQLHFFHFRVLIWGLSFLLDCKHYKNTDQVCLFHHGIPRI